VTLFGLTIHALTLEQTADRVERLIREGPVHQQVSINVDKAVKADRDPELRAIINGADLVNADGAPIVWASRLLGRPLPERVAGIDLMQALFERAEKAGHRVYFLGATAGALAEVLERIERDHPGLRVAGSRNGYWQADEEPSVVAGIAATAPDILFVALPSPRKERFIARWREELRAAFVMGVGGSFDVYAGRVTRAPRWLQRVGGEWLYRLAQEPGRFWRRYLVDDVRFIPLVVRELLHRPRRP
jgi:N-acetylglucosaminyldiphosphoundecaprenol N-acetyl-beta-D-mannosaminyltransferase